MRDIRSILEGIVSQAKPVGSGGSAFRHSSSSGVKGPEHGIDVGAHRNYDHEVRAKKQTLDSAEKREREIEKRNREAEQRQKETSKMAKEETVTEAKKFVFDKPHAAMVKAYEKRDTSELHGMHKRWSADHSSPKNNPETSEKLLAVHHVLKKRGESVGELPKHKNLGLTMHEESNTEKRMAIKNVARLNDAPPTSEKSTLAKTSEINTKIIEDKLTMSLPNFGLSASLINAARQIFEKKSDDSATDAKKMTGGKTVVDTDPETNDAPDDSDDKPAKKKSHTVPKTEKEKKLAAIASPKDKITHKDVLVGRGVVKEEDELEEQFVVYHKDSKNLVSTHANIATAKKHAEKKGSDYATASKDHWHTKINPKRSTNEEVTLSAEEIERIEAIAAQLDEAKPTIVSSPIRGANQDQSGHGTKDSTADYTISDEKKNEKPPFKGPYTKSDTKAPARSHLKSLVKQARTGAMTKEEVELEEAIKIGSKVKMHAPGKDYHGQVGRVGEIDHGQFKGAAKKFTVDYGDDGKKSVMVSKDNVKMHKEEVELDEARGRPRKNPLPPGKEAEEGDDTHKHPMQQLEKIAHAVVGAEPHFEHKDGTKTNVGKHLARHMVVLHNSMKTTQEKNNFADKMHANRDSMRSEMTKHF